MSVPIQFTILTDDEVEPENDEIEDFDESKPSTIKTKEGSKTSKRKRGSLIAIEFDTGDLPTYADVDDDENHTSGDEVNSRDHDRTEIARSQPAESDNVKIMVQETKRFERVLDKKKKKAVSAAIVTTTSAKQAASLDSDEIAAMEAAATEAAYFDRVIEGGLDRDTSIMFTQLNLSRPFLRAIEAMGYTTPTPVQRKVIPLAMAGRDICASAVTGSGKTAAFALPILERLLYRPKEIPSIRVLIVTPTRELATQIGEVVGKLAQFTDITSCLVCGGKKDVKAQEAELRNRPDVVVCTPGRILDHLRNSHSVTLDDLDVLVLDEVDKLLDMGFQEEVEQLVRHCPLNRQTMLFSATMTPKVEDLARLSLKRPIRIKTAASEAGSGPAGAGAEFAPRLIQEFVKVRKQEEVEAMLASLLCRSFGKKTIVFYETKRDAHRFCQVLGLLGKTVCELHGDIPQPLRYAALQRFREGQVDVMVATDVAARGLDIPGVQTVINSEMPRNASTYVHRVGRTARAGCGGRAITLVSDARRKVMKDVLKDQANKAAAGQVEGVVSEADSKQMLSRTIPQPIITHYVAKIAALEPQILELVKQEIAKARLDRVQMEVDRAENLLVHSEEIKGRPARTWHETETQKKERREVGREMVKHEKEVARVGAVEAAAKLAISDDYRVEEKDRKNLKRLPRKKRRRLEAMQELQDQDNENNKDDENEDDGASRKKQKKHSVVVGLEMAPKRAKLAAREKVSKELQRTIGELGMKRVQSESRNPRDGDDDDGLAEPRSQKQKQGNKVVRQKFAVGGLDQSPLEWGGAGGGGQKKKSKDAAAAAFTDFDPNRKLRKGGKISTNAFKSKKKYKRRK
mmetsp:Transcript_19229/g.27521  ORF Transcript_19229/g.27521 Transcript_19229/m.27521 type:complete len:857 (+) Transcript_19229:1298-3868(+)